MSQRDRLSISGSRIAIPSNVLSVGNFFSATDSPLLLIWSQCRVHNQRRNLWYSREGKERKSISRTVHITTIKNSLRTENHRWKECGESVYHVPGTLRAYYPTGKICATDWFSLFALARASFSSIPVKFPVRAQSSKKLLIWIPWGNKKNLQGCENRINQKLASYVL